MTKGVIEQDKGIKSRKEQSIAHATVYLTIYMIYKCLFV